MELKSDLMILKKFHKIVSMFGMIRSLMIVEMPFISTSQISFCMTSITCVVANWAVNCVDLGLRDLKKALVWNATTGRGYSLSVLVCEVKSLRRLGELKKRTCNDDG